MKFEFKCPSCFTYHTADEWDQHTQRMNGFTTVYSLHDAWPDYKEKTTSSAWYDCPECNEQVEAHEMQRKLRKIENNQEALSLLNEGEW